MFRYRKSIPLPYNRRGYIYFQSLLYLDLAPRDQERIVKLCKQSAGQYWRALLEYVTTSANAPYIEQKHHISQTTLYRITRGYYLRFPKKL